MKVPEYPITLDTNNPQRDTGDRVVRDATTRQWKEHAKYKNSTESFNIDAAKKYETDYRNKDLFDDFDLALGDQDLNQMISFETWSKVINNV